MKKSVSVKQDYIMIIHNPVENDYIYHLYHVLDISVLNDETIINIQTRGKDNVLKRFHLSERKFYDLLSSGILTRVQK